MLDKILSMSDRVRFQLSGFMFIAFCVIALIAGMLRLPDSGGASLSTLLNGESASRFEKDFSRNSVFYGFSKRLWGNIEYGLFGQGRKGVVVGKDGWLFPAEEFETSRAAGDIYVRHVNYIGWTSAFLKKRNIRLYIALIPAKARLHAENFPEEKKEILGRFIGDVKVPIVSLGTALGGNGFLKTDTHWSPDGAKASAKAIARLIGRDNSKARYSNIEGKEIAYKGDLLKYIPVSRDLGTDSIHTYDFEQPASDNLFGDQDIPVALVGTSYSAKPEFNFANFLKEFLNMDVLNASDQGQGPFVTMRDYLKSEAFNTAPPRIIVWEIPERYLTIEVE